jgi:alkaline phosphatase D
MKKIIFLTMIFLGLSKTFAQNKRVNLDPLYAPFYHGVASGDPLPDRVIIWTRVTPDSNFTGSITVNWKMATDTSLSNVVKSGTFITNEDRDYTVKIDVDGLQPNQWYYYEFETNGRKSLIGRTRTAPSGNIDSLRFAIVSCSSWDYGYFNSYGRIDERNDIDAVLHLGDYIYEYPLNTSRVRQHEPSNEIVTLSDYRIRHSQYKLDPQLRKAHQQYPFITVWDDHETANDSYKDGAENHQPATEGDWYIRKNNGVRAYKEWMPIREPDPNDTIRIWRQFTWGNLLNLMMIDTRLYDRDQQVAANSPNLNDTTRQMIGAVQRAWLENQLSNSTQKWNIIGQQVMFAPLKVLNQIVNADQWDGYPAERNRVINFIMDNNIPNPVILTGDIHTAWANDIPYQNYNGTTGAGSMGVEFVTTSVTSPGADFISNLSSFGNSVIKSQNPHMKFIDLTRRGYLILDLNHQRVQGDFYFVNRVDQVSSQETFAEGWYCNDGTRRLQKANSASVRPGTLPIKAPALPNNPVNRTKEKNFFGISSYPNPYQNAFDLQFYTHKPAPVQVKIIDVNGRTIKTYPVFQSVSGLNHFQIETPNVVAGTYFLIMESNGETFQKRIIKN